MIKDEIKKIRTHLGISQEGLARMLNVGWASVNRWENGHNIPSPLAMEKIKAIAKKAGVEIGESRPRLKLGQKRKEVKKDGGKHDRGVGEGKGPTEK